MKYLWLLLVSQLSWAQDWSSVDKLVRASIKARHIPGAVVYVGTADKILYKNVYGKRDRSDSENVSFDTLYDLASLTKVVGTTSAVMKLIEDGSLKLDQKLGTIFPEIESKVQGDIEIEHLLRHRSGLPASLEVKPAEKWEDYLKRVLTTPLNNSIDQVTLYSDLSFIILGEVVTRVTKKPLELYVEENVLASALMVNTKYSDKLTPSSPCALASATRCRPHDPKAAHFFPKAMGHAGLFTTGSDMAGFASFYLKGLRLGQDAFLKAATMKDMVTLKSGQERGLGWDLLSELSPKPRGAFTQGVSFGHTGYTGTSIWIDPKLNVYLVLLTNRVFLEPDTSANIGELRRDLSNAVVEEINKMKDAK